MLYTCPSTAINKREKPTVTTLRRESALRAAAVRGADEDFPSRGGRSKCNHVTLKPGLYSVPCRCALFIQLDILCILHRESLSTLCPEHVLAVLRNAPILTSSTEEQYFAVTGAPDAVLVQALTHQNAAFALRSLAS